jgi:hypothetical protein
MSFCTAPFLLPCYVMKFLFPEAEKMGLPHSGLSVLSLWARFLVSL